MNDNVRNEARASNPKVDALFVFYVVILVLVGLLWLYYTYSIIRRYYLRALFFHQWPLTPLPHHPDVLTAVSQHPATYQPGYPADASITIPLQAISIRTPMDVSQRHRNHRPFLSLPPEIRTQIYSFLLPSSQPASVARALRGTCHQINREVKYEVQTDFSRTMTFLQHRTSCDNQWVILTQSPEHFRVNVVLQTPHIYSAPSIAPLPHTTTIVDALALSLAQQLPTSTRSMTITLQPHADGSVSCFERYLNAVWTTLFRYLGRLQTDISLGGNDLRQITVLCGGPIVMLVEARYGRISYKFWSIDVVGVTFKYHSTRGCYAVLILREGQRCRKLIQTMFDLMRRRAQFYIRCKRR